MLQDDDNDSAAADDNDDDDVILEMYSSTSKLFQIQFTKEKFCIANFFLCKTIIKFPESYNDMIGLFLNIKIYLYFFVISIKYLIHLFSFGARSSTF
jgi:hypothetical protein